MQMYFLPGVQVQTQQEDPEQQKKIAKSSKCGQQVLALQDGDKYSLTGINKMT